VKWQHCSPSACKTVQMHTNGARNWRPGATHEVIPLINSGCNQVEAADTGAWWLEGFCNALREVPLNVLYYIIKNYDNHT